MVDTRFTNMTSPIEGGDTVVPNDSLDLPTPSRALNVGVAGDVRVTTEDGSVVTVNIAAGVVFPIRAVRVWATGTTADSISALW